MNKPQLGDIVEISTAKGLAYAHYTHEHPRYGSLLRVFDNLFEKQPTDFSSVVAGKVRFSTFFPLSAAINEGVFRVVHNCSVTDLNKLFPIFKTGILNPDTKKVKNWWLWDGEKEWPVETLSTQQKKFPVRGIWNDTLLIARIEQEWKPEDEV